LTFIHIDTSSLWTTATADISVAEEAIGMGGCVADLCRGRNAVGVPASLEEMRRPRCRLDPMVGVA
jgi:hypothetical protein